MAVSVRGATNFVGGGGSASPGKPSGTVSGDLVLLIMQCDGATSAVTPPSGFSSVTSLRQGTASTDPAIYIWSKTAGGSEPSNYTFGGATGMNWGMAGAITFAGVGTLSVDQSVTNGSNTQSTTISSGSITPTKASMLVLFTSLYSTTATVTQTATGSMSEQFDTGPGNNYGGACYTESSTSTSSLSRTSTASAAAEYATVLLNVIDSETNISVSPTVAGTITYTGIAPSISTSSDTTISVTAPGTTTFASAGNPTVSTSASISAPVAGTITVTAPNPTVTINNYWGVIDADNPYLWWQMEDLSGSQCTDYSGNALHGVISGAVVAGYTGMAGYANNFTTGGAITSGSGSLIASTTVGFSAEFWVKDITSTSYLIGAAGASDLSAICAYNNSTYRLTWNIFGSTGAGATTFVSEGVNLGDGEWHQIVLTVSKKNSNIHTLKSYVDGVQRTSVSGDTLTLSGSNYAFFYGALAHSSFTAMRHTTGVGPVYSYTIGKLDELSLWGDELTSTQVVNHYNSRTVVAGSDVSIAAPAPGTITYTGVAPSVSVGSNVTVSPTVASTITVSGKNPIVTAGDGNITIGTDPVTFTYAGLAPTVSVVREVSVSVTNVPNVTYAAPSPIVSTSENLFNFISPTNTAFTALDATTLSTIEFGTFTHTQAKVKKFMLGNLSTDVSNFTVDITSTNADIIDMVELSTDGITYSDSVTITGVQPNGITDAIWIRFTVTEDAYTSTGTFLVRVEQEYV